MTIQVYPVTVVTLDVPENTHVDQLAVVGLTGNDLDNDGGELHFTELG